jgi:hypothetical protein
VQRHARGHGEASAWLGWIALLTWTFAWTVAGFLEKEAYQPRRDHISGLAALNAQHPSVMIAGFVLTGALILVLTAHVWRARPGNGWALAGTALMLLVGVGFVAAGLLRSDCADAVRACTIRDASGASSWHSQAHNVIASALFVYALVPALFALALRHVHRARGLCVYSLATAAAGAVLLAAFQLDWLVEWEGAVQRAAVSIPLVWTAVIGRRIGRLHVGAAAGRLRDRAIAQFRREDRAAVAPRLFYFSEAGRWSVPPQWTRRWVWNTRRRIGPRAPPTLAALAA